MCIFCDIIMGYEPATFYYNSGYSIAIKDIYKPQPHGLLIPKRHIQDIRDLTKKEFYDIMNVGLNETLLALGIKAYLLEIHAIMHQSIPHLHCHVHNRLNVR